MPKKTDKSEANRKAAAALAAPPGSPRRFVKMFQPRFAHLVERGEQCQTVRPVPKRMPKPGDTVSLREWTGKPYRSKQRELREARITDVKPVFIDDHSIKMVPPDGCLMAAIGVPVIELRGEDADKFAQTDGFCDWVEMSQWFRGTHGLPFDGIVIYWENASGEPHGPNT